MAVIDETHDPALETWVQGANESAEFPIQNLPLACFRYNGKQRIGAAIGDFVLDLGTWLPGDDLSAFFRLRAADRAQLRRSISRALRLDAPERELYPQSECEFLLPCAIGDYTDFYASIHHARNIGALFRPDNPLLPNYRYVPIAYHGRASSIVTSGTAIRRPCGQLGEGRFGATEELDYEVELSAFVGTGNRIGEWIPISQAQDQVAGVCLLNDWSARDIQRWEYQPLGPFLGKNFATTTSPWVVTAEALAPFQVAPPCEDRREPHYLRSDEPAALDVNVEAFLRPAGSKQCVSLSLGHFREMYWTFAQMIAHHTINGCPLRPGDLIGSGTISGPEKRNRGCLLELTQKGREPLQLPDGSTRSFLLDGDEIELRGYCERDGFRRIGFGSCRGVIEEAICPD